jgi:hypothetical protein
MVSHFFTPETLANNTYTDLVLSKIVKGREVPVLAPIFAPLPLNALLLGVFSWQVTRYFTNYAHSDSRLTKGLVLSLMVSSIATTVAVCGEPPSSGLSTARVS